MKRFFSFLSIAVLFICLSESCSKLNNRIDDLEKRVYDIETVSIEAIKSQIGGITTTISELTALSIALQSQIEDLQKDGEIYLSEINILKAQEEIISARIEELTSYMENELKKYATRDWVDATFVTLDKYEETFSAITELRRAVAGFDAKIESAVSSAISNIEKSFKSWVNAQLGNYYTMSQTDSKLRLMADALEKALADLGATLETMIKSVTIVPAYDDGSVEATDGLLSVNFIVKPAKVLRSIRTENLKDSINVLVSAAKPAVRSEGLYEEIAVKDAVVLDYEKGEVNITADISAEFSGLAAGKSLTVAIEVKNGISEFSTEFVKVTRYVNDGSKKFVVLSDIHLMHPDLLVHEGKAFDKYNWEECKLLRESPEIFAATLERAQAYRPDFLIVCGDMSKDGEIISHKYVADKLDEFAQKTGAKILVVPGNHDLTNPHSFKYDGDVSTQEPSATEADFEQIYANCGYRDAVARGPRRLDYMSYPVEGVAFIGVDSNEENTPDNAAVQGGLTKAQVSWVKDMVEKAHADNRNVIMGMHHNLLEFYNNASLIRGANIANANYDEYTNGQLVTDLCDAGIDVVFSGHSHMHSITSEKRNAREIFSIVTSSLVNLPLAYRTGNISKEGLMTVNSGYVQDITPSNGVNLREEGKKYWVKLSQYYMYEASRVCWENEMAKMLVSEMLGLGSREEVEAVLTAKAKIPFYNFTYFTSNGNEHLFSPDENSEEAKAALDGIVDYVIDGIARKWMEDDDELSYEEAIEAATASVDFVVYVLLGMSLDDAKSMLYDFLDSAYHNYYGTNHTPVPDDSITIQLSK